MTGLDFKTIGKKIKERRLTVGLTQEMLADELDVNASHISNVECGRAHPSLTTLVKIANILECSVDYFISSEYTFPINDIKQSCADELIMEKIKNYDSKKKDTILKMIDLIQ